MSKVIWKFKLEMNRVALPIGAVLLEMQITDGSLFLWALCDPEAPVLSHQTRVVATGEPVPDGKDWRYLKTLFAGAYVWHVFIEDGKHE